MERIDKKLSINRAAFLGKGKYGSVFKGSYKTIVPVAINRFDKSVTTVDGDLYLKSAGYPNIISYYGTSKKDVEFR